MSGVGAMTRLYQPYIPRLSTGVEPNRDAIAPQQHFAAAASTLQLLSSRRHSPSHAALNFKIYDILYVEDVMG